MFEKCLMCDLNEHAVWQGMLAAALHFDYGARSAIRVVLHAGVAGAWPDAGVKKPLPVAGERRADSAWAGNQAMPCATAASVAPSSEPTTGTQLYDQSLSRLPLIGSSACMMRGARSRAGLIA